MFVYSLDGLEIDGDIANDVEIEDNEITARAGVYQVLSRLFIAPDEETWKTAVEGRWPQKLREAAELLAYDFDFGVCALSDAVSFKDFQAEYIRLFEVGSGDGGPPVPVLSGTWSNEDRRKEMEEIARFFEYFGLKTSADDPRPPDHLATELEFMQYLAFKEAASPSPRLGGSFHRAQEDFMNRQLLTWLDKFAEALEAENTMPFWVWAGQTVARFVKADLAYLQA